MKLGLQIIMSVFPHSLSELWFKVYCHKLCSH